MRTFTALVTAMGNDSQWERAIGTIRDMRGQAGWATAVEPNAYTYSALLKAMGEKVRAELFLQFPPFLLLPTKLPQQPFIGDSRGKDTRGKDTFPTLPAARVRVYIKKLTT